VKAYISNGWDSRIVDPTLDKQYTRKKAEVEHHKDEDNVIELNDVECWPKGPYTQQIKGVLPPVLTEEVIMNHLQSSGKRLKKNTNYSNVDYSTLQRGHQYFMESYIPGRYVRFCAKDSLVWVQARCYRSQKKNDTMHELKLVISTCPPYHVAKASCSCTAGTSGMCSHIVGLLKQLIHYVMMRLPHVPVDLTCTQMQQSWHKPRPSAIEPTPVMNITFCKAKQSTIEAKKDPVICSLYEARAKSLQGYSYEQQQSLQHGLKEDHPSCAYAQILPDLPPEELVSTLFGRVPKGSILSYHALEYEKAHKTIKEASHTFPALPIGVLENMPCVFPIEDEQQHTQLSKITLTLDEAHSLELNTCQQSLSTSWHQSRIGRVTASRFGDVVLRQSLPTEPFINSFFTTKEFTSTAVSHGIQNEVKARNAYTSKTGFAVRKCGLVVNPSLPWLGASPDGMVKDPAEQSFGLLEIKCPYTYRLSTVEEACADPNFFATIKNDVVTLKESHKHFYQIQGQMALSKISWCDFVIYTHRNFTVERIKFNEDYWNDTEPKLTEFYFNYILPRTCINMQHTEDDVNN